MCDLYISGGRVSLPCVEGAIENAPCERNQRVMKKRLFVGGLNWETTDMDLRDAFNEYGDVVDATVITDRYSGRSRGFGFVSFASPDGAEEAKQEMNGATLDGRTLRVDEAHERGGGGGGGGGGRW